MAGGILRMSPHCQSIHGIPGYFDIGVPMAGGILRISPHCQSVHGIPGYFDIGLSIFLHCQNIYLHPEIILCLSQYLRHS